MDHEWVGDHELFIRDVSGVTTLFFTIEVFNEARNFT